MNTIKMLEDKYEALKFELTLPMDDMVKAEVMRELDETYNTLKFFQTLEKTEEFVPWNKDVK